MAHPTKHVKRQRKRRATILARRPKFDYKIPKWEELHARGLTIREALFVWAYLKDGKFQAGPAAVRAGYSPHTATVKGSQLLTVPRIKNEIALVVEGCLAKYQLELDDFMQDVYERTQVDIGLFATWDNKTITLRPHDELPPGVTRHIRELSTDGKRVKLTLYDPAPYYEIRAKYHGLGKNKVTVNGEGFSAESDGGIHIWLPDNGRQTALPSASIGGSGEIIDMPVPESDADEVVFTGKSEPGS